ncbi:arsenosugar biosynthesis radical SAM (seleno)protein ArsS [Halpernia sp. GG3]
MVKKERKISLLGQHHNLSNAQRQLQILEYPEFEGGKLAAFDAKINETKQFPILARNVEILQINMGKMCNQVCEHCHVDAGPDRKEIMTHETMEQCINALKNNPTISTIDLTGGAPEMNPGFRCFVEEIKKLNRHIIVRCNLTIILANKKYYDLPNFYKENNMEVVCSLPFYTQDRTDRQRGNHVFEKSIEALKMLNEIGYGKENSSLMLNLVYNPAGAFLPPSQISLEKEYKDALFQRFGITFNNLFAITNLPISRFLSYLIKSENYESYMQKLVEAYNPAAVGNVMCRQTISVGWDGFLYDCDFNQMLEMKVNGGSEHISEFRLENLNNRLIKTGQHCYGCTAGDGSSCGGTVT